jgi:predicted nicotinamide N-methyase
VALEGIEVTLLHPARSDDLISEADFVGDDRMPYWADIWPASRILANEVRGEAARQGTTLLELGCGLGLVSVAAITAGFDVTATDYYDDALDFAHHNVEVNCGASLRTGYLDWRDQTAQPLGQFDYVVASDVLYERDYGRLVAELAVRHLRTGGTMLMADPGRVAAPAFLERSRELGLKLVLRTKHPVVDDGRQQTVELIRLVRV